MKCDNLTFEECELAILRTAVDKIQKKHGSRLLESKKVQSIIDIVENFIKDKKLICYGGTAINNILPKNEQFYDKDSDFPDYDFYSPNALDDVKELAQIVTFAGLNNVEAKAGIHHGTYKLFVKGLSIADITQLNDELFENLSKTAIKKEGIMYCSPDFLRMNMYLELSRPLGDVSRWEKVLKRISLLNKHYPLEGDNCKHEDIQRLFESKQISNDDVYESLFNSFISTKCVFFGAYAYKLYSKYLNTDNNYSKIGNIPDFDVLSNNPEKVYTKIVDTLKKKGINNVKVIEHDGIGEIISKHYEVVVDDDTVAFIYEPLACHSYNMIKRDTRTIRIATIDTMMSFYLAFLSVNRPYYNKNRLLCLCEFLFKIQQKNRLAQRGLLKRFSMNCIGVQSTLQMIRQEKVKMYDKLKDKKGTREYDEWFLRYIPRRKRKGIMDIEEIKSKSKSKSSSKSISKSRKKSRSKSKSRSRSRTRKKSKSKSKSKTSSSFFNIFK